MSLERLADLSGPVERAPLAASRCGCAGHTERVWHCAWSPSGTELATCSADKTIKIWGADAGAWVHRHTLDDVHERTMLRE